MVNVTAEIAQMREARKRELYRRLAMNKAGFTIVKHAKRFWKADPESRLGRSLALAFKFDPDAAVATECSSDARLMTPAGGAGISELTGRGPNWLMEVVNRNKLLGHGSPHDEKLRLWLAGLRGAGIEVVLALELSSKT